MSKTVIKHSLFLIAMCSIVACSTQPEPVIDTVKQETTEPSYYQPVTQPKSTFEQGGVFQQTFHGNWLQSRKQRRIGDIVTVELVENIDATKSSSVTYNKSQEFALADIKAGSANILGVDLDSENKFVGKGDSSKSNTLNGDIAVRIVTVLPNSLFRVKGERQLQINEGGETVVIEGLIRAEDIQSNNTVLSTNIADAKISYVSKGVMDSVSEPGWFAEFIYKYFPF